MKKFNSKLWTALSIVICLALSVFIWLVAKYVNTENVGNATTLLTHLGNFRG